MSRDLDEALARLYRRNLHTIKLGLDEVRGLLDVLGRPEEALLTVHVAGTNGKGSVCAMLAGMLESAGFRTGLYTSPHLVRFNERIRVQGQDISDAELSARMDEVEEAVGRRAHPGRNVTFFEFTTALAFAHFRRAGVQIAVVETGMGGRLDATNVVTPLVSVITPIGLDHCAWLGDTLEQIAGEKAGIIKPARPVVLGGPQPPEALAVLQRAAQDLGAPCTLAWESVSVRRLKQSLSGQRIAVETQDVALGPFDLPLPGRHQLDNVATAVAAMGVVAEACGVPLPAPAVLAKGLASIRWPARLQLVHEQPPVLLDGAHNPAAAAVLAASIRELAGKRPVALVCGFLADKDAVGFLRALAPRADAAWLVPAEGERAMAMPAMQAAARTAGCRADEAASVTDALALAQSWAEARGGVVLVCGSLYLAGAVLRHFGR